MPDGTSSSAFMALLHPATSKLIAPTANNANQRFGMTFRTPSIHGLDRMSTADNLYHRSPTRPVPHGTHSTIKNMDFLWIFYSPLPNRRFRLPFCRRVNGARDGSVGVAKQSRRPYCVVGKMRNRRSRTSLRSIRAPALLKDSRDP